MVFVLFFAFRHVLFQDIDKSLAPKNGCLLGHGQVLVVFVDRKTGVVQMPLGWFQGSVACFASYQPAAGNQIFAADVHSECLKEGC